MKKLLYILIFLSHLVDAQVPDLVKEIRTLPPTTPTNSTTYGGGQYPLGQATMGGYVYFWGKSCQTCGYSLYKSNGTAAGTHEIRSFNGDGDRNFQLIASNNKVFFKIDWHIYATDGTTAGTVEIASDVTRFSIGLVICNNYLYYFENKNGQSQLTKSDGTVAGTTVVYQFGTSSPDRLFDNNGTLFFTVDNIYLWKSDGTNAGTSSIAGTNGFENPVNVNGTLYFNVGTQLWKTQGTLATTGVVTTLSNIPSYLTNLSGVLYFVNGNALWKSDGTASGTVLVKNIATGLYDLKAFNNTLYFSGNDGITGYELWRSDGTIAGTYLVKDINVGTNNGLYSLDGYLIPPTNNVFYFFGNDGSTGNEIWRSDGTNVGTYLVKDIYAGVNSSFSLYNTDFLGVANSSLLFTANDGVTGLQLWKTDGTNANTTLLKTIAPSISSSFDFLYSIPNIAQLDSNNLIVVPKDDSDTTALWKTDGTAINTLKIKKIQLDNFNTGDFGRLNNKLYFSGGYFSSTFGNFDLWVTDGTTTGTQLLTNLRPSGSSSPSQFYTFNSLVYLEAWNSATQRSLYRTDGTVVGTFKLLDNYSIGDYVEYNGNLYFKNFKGNLYRTDGSVANTVAVTNLSISNSINASSDLAVVNDLIFFVAYNASSGAELWSSNGTIAGTGLVKDINLGVSSSSIQNFAVLNNSLYFLAFDGTNYGLWKSDGTNAGTVLVKALGNKVNITYSFQLKNVNNVLYFEYNDGIYGHELWKSDGTLAGTVLVKDINPNGSSAPRNLTDINGKLYFTANDNIHGMELWVSDGTVAGTNMLNDVNFGVGGSFPQSITYFNNYIYFIAFSATNGYELWRFDPNNNIFESITTGNWNVGSTWISPSNTLLPTATKTAKINSTHTVTIPNTDNEVKTIQMNGGIINLNGGTLEIKNQ